MKPVEYLDFEIEIGLGQGREYPLAVIRSPGGEARQRMVFPFDELTLRDRLKDLEIALLRSSGNRRQIINPHERTVQEFGQKLFDALISDEIRSRYDVSQREAAQRGLGMRIKLRIQPPELASLPWEFLYDQRQAEYVCLSRQTPLVRYIELPKVIQPLSISSPLQILGLTASPAGLAGLDIENEKQRVEIALDDLVSSGQVQITWLEHATRRTLQRSMRQGPWHILHFIGHGGFDTTTDEGLIALESEQGELDRLPATLLARLLADHASLRLVVLNSCDGAQGGKTDVFSSTASLLVRRGIPAVLAMQYEITDRAAIEFARGFYEALADGFPVDASTAEARKSVSLGQTNTIEWGTPVLYMHTPDGVLFKPETVAEKVIRLRTERQKREPARHEKEALKAQSETEKVPDREDTLSDGHLKSGDLPEPSNTKPSGLEKQAISGWLMFALGILVLAISWAIYAQIGKYGGKTPPSTSVLITTSTPTLISSQVYNPQPAADDFIDQKGVPMRLVPAGKFTMGSNQSDYDEQPVHTVLLDEYIIDKYEVTNTLYAACVDAGSCTAPKEKKSNTRSSYYGNSTFGNYPVISVDWNMAKTYCEWREMRLPTEAEWEKAARGTDQRTYPWGEGIDQTRANYNKKAGDTNMVGSFPGGVSPYGLYDMAGNVWEWTADWYYDGYYALLGQNAANPTGAVSGSERVQRSSSWSSSQYELLASNRVGGNPNSWSNNLGFRCARSSRGPAPTGNLSPDVSVTPTATPEITLTVTSTATPEITLTVTPTATPEITLTATPTATPEVPLTTPHVNITSIPVVYNLPYRLWVGLR
jgi:formylglycine-generating enzyme required for sulfatase activity